MESLYNTSIMSIDVEDGLSILMRDIFNVEMPPTERVIRNVHSILDLFEKTHVKGTFFILGEVAVAYPGLIRSIDEAGHEIGVHGLHHDQIFKLDRQKAHESIFKAKEILEGITGKRVFGFRAPAFSINERTAWSLDVVSELGFKYDSSIMPVSTDRYGWPGFNRGIVRLILPSRRSLFEVPLSVVKIGRLTVPACGGGYLRHLPYFFTRKSLLSIQSERPAVVYLHPYELDVEKYPDYFYRARSTAKLRHKIPLMFYRMNKRTVEGKLKKMVEEFNFKPIINVVDDLENTGLIPVKYL